MRCAASPTRKPGPARYALATAAAIVKPDVPSTSGVRPIASANAAWDGSRPARTYPHRPDPNGTTTPSASGCLTKISALGRDGIPAARNRVSVNSPITPSRSTPMPSAVRTVLRHPSAPTTNRARTSTPPTTARTPSADVRNAVSAAPKRTVPPSLRTSSTSTGSRWSCGMTAGRVGLAARISRTGGQGNGTTSCGGSDRRSVIVTVGSQAMLPRNAASATPQPRRTSMVWMETPVARGTVDGPARRSTTSTRAPWRSAESAVARPAGPAPTMSTSVVNMPPRSRADGPGTSVSATYLDLGQYGPDQPLHRGEVHRQHVLRDRDG